MTLVQKAIAATLLGGTLAACNSDSLIYSQLRVYHASPDAPKVNVLVDGKTVLSGVDYQQSSGALKVKAGTRSIQVDAILADGSTTTVIGPADFNLANTSEYNLVATGKVASDGSDGKGFGPQLSSRVDVTPSEARVQVMHSAPDAPTVDVFITAPGADLSQSTPFADDVSYLDVTEAVNVADGDYQVRITDPSDPTTVFFDSGTFNVPAGSDWFVAATDNTSAGASPVSLLIDTGESSLLVQDVNSGADIRVVHGISDAPGVDVYVDGAAPAASSPLLNLEFKDQTDYLALDAGSTAFTVAVTGTSTFVDNLTLTADLVANTTYTAIAIGDLGDGLSNDKLYVVEDDVRRVATEAKLRAIHASTIAGTVDIYVSSDATPSNDDFILEDIPYEGDSGLLPITPSDVYVMITPANNSSVIAVGPVLLNLTGGSITTLVAVDDPSSGSGVGALSLDD
jgi:hypothetical protein